MHPSPFRPAIAAGLLAVLLLLAGCATAPTAPAEGSARPAVPAFPEAFYRDPPVAGSVFRVDPERSRLEVLVFRAGALANRGHNHLVRAGSLQGAVFLADAPDESRLDLHLPVAALQVDPAAERRAAGAAFAAPVDEAARRGTRDNMLGPRVLDADRFPLVVVSGRVLAGELPWLLLELQLQVRGQPHRVTVPVQLELDGAQLRARGLLALRHAELGLEPFTALGGLMAVADPLLLRFDIVATQ